MSEEFLRHFSEADKYVNDIYDNVSPREPWNVPTRNVDVLLMFGPLHGKTFNLPLSCLTSDVLVAMEEHTERSMYQLNPMYTSMIDGPNGLNEGMPPRHFYKKMDEFGNSNMEECLLYVHDDSCCEKTMEDTNDAKNSRRAGPRGQVRPIW